MTDQEIMHLIATGPLTIQASVSTKAKTRIESQSRKRTAGVYSRAADGMNYQEGSGDPSLLRPSQKQVIAAG
jgi:hypothetical protein